MKGYQLWAPEGPACTIQHVAYCFWSPARERGKIGRVLAGPQHQRGSGEIRVLVEWLQEARYRAKAAQAIASPRLF
jgi:hypothetical protein